MTFPKSIKVGGRRYTIKLVKDELDGSAGALCDTSKLSIALESNASEEAIRHRLLHEVIHGINIEFDEDLTEFLTVLFEQVLVDNPDFTKLFLKNGG